MFVNLLSNTLYTSSGSLVASEWIVTAAHCIDDSADGYAVFLGTNDLFNPEDKAEAFLVEEVFQHPLLSKTKGIETIAINVALMKISGISQHSPVTLDDGSTTLAAGKPLAGKKCIQLVSSN